VPYRRDDMLRAPGPAIDVSEPFTNSMDRRCYISAGKGDATEKRTLHGVRSEE
jgi:hypothetical protein